MALWSGRSLPARELRRKLFHVFLGTAFILVLLTESRLMYAASVLFILGLALSVVHRNHPIRMVGRVLDHFDREGDVLPGTGIITFFLGVLLAWLLFPRDIAVAGCIVMTFGDPMASVIGITLGSHACPYNRRKTIEGTASFMIFSFMGLVLVFGPILALAGSIGGAIVESIRHPKGSLLNDNVTIPLGASTSIYLIISIFGL
jgi:dolichol kinase